MTDIMSPETRSRVMSRIRGKGTTPERYIEALLRASGVRFRQHERVLPGCPDFVFSVAKLAVFVHGDFWHGWRFPIWQHRLSEPWRAKIAGNRARDLRCCRKLARMGWRVLKIWEHQVEHDALACARRIVKSVGAPARVERMRKAQAKLPPLKRRDRLPKP
jgi:DNA mismatch endonuclease (patch repair protein)